MSEFTFEKTPWEQLLDALPTGGALSAGEFLAAMEEETDEAVEDAFLELMAASVSLDVSDLPRPTLTGDAAVRLRQEQQLVEKGLRPGDLEANDPLRLYLEELASIPVCGDPKLLAAELGEKNQKGIRDDALRARLMNLYLSRVVELAGEYTGCGVLLMDLIQEGSLGLWQSTMGESIGADFDACCDWWVRNYMAKAVVMQARSSGLGQKMRQAVEDYRMVDERLLTELGRNPTTEEIAELLHMSVEETEAVRKLLDNARMVGKAHTEPEPEEEEQEEAEAVEDTAAYKLRERIEDLLSALSEEDAKLITLRYGLDGKAPMTAAEAGRKLGLTPDEVTAREAKALAALRNE